VGRSAPSAGGSDKPGRQRTPYWARFVFWTCYLLLAVPVGGLLLAGTFAFHGPSRSAIYGAVVLVAPVMNYRRILAALLGGRRR
jgi:hypothetical protein